MTDRTPTTGVVLAPSDDGDNNTFPTSKLTEIIAPGATGVIATVIGPVVTDTPTPKQTSTRTAVVATITHHTTAYSATATDAPAQSHLGLPTSTLIPAIVVPVVIFLILIPATILAFFHFRNKRLQQSSRRLSTPDMRGPPTEAALLQKQSQPAMSHTSYDGEKSVGSGGMGVFEDRNSLERDHGESIAMYQRNRSSSRGSSAHSPSPTLPSPKFSQRPPVRPESQDAWPLPAHAMLPEPQPGSPTAPTSHQLPPMILTEPLSIHDTLRADHSLYSFGTAAFPEPPKSAASGAEREGILKSRRDSDLVSEMSDGEDERVPGKNRRDTDAISIVSAITSRSRSHKRKSSTRDTDAISVVSALSPGLDEPELPMQPFPRH